MAHVAQFGILLAHVGHSPELKYLPLTQAVHFPSETPQAEHPLSVHLAHPPVTG